MWSVYTSDPISSLFFQCDEEKRCSWQNQKNKNKKGELDLETKSYQILPYVICAKRQVSD